ncbi:MAG: hypothetical protein ACXVJD_10515, partial [Mucilaginibacter sp.]
KIIAKCLEKSPENRYANGTALHDMIAQDSITEIKVEVVKEIAAAAPAEAPGEYKPDTGGMIYISKPVFAGLMILLLGFMVYTAYSLFRPASAVVKHLTTVTPDTARINDSIRNAEEQQNLAYKRKHRQNDSAAQSAINDITDREKVRNPSDSDSTSTDTARNRPNNQ